ncbi:hypothetical protein G6F55_014177 [Rhizopus delemar]|nr:hypothetical protein G6F55_014177 [Rhizopus delemar]
MFVNDPGFHVDDEKLFDGKRMTYYGRWTYKFEEAARRGAEGGLIVHETAPAAYGWATVKISGTSQHAHWPRRSSPTPVSISMPRSARRCAPTSARWRWTTQR